MPYSEFEDSFGDTSYSDQLLRLDQTCERSHLDGWFCPSESFFCPSLVGILPEGAFCPQGLSNSLSNPGSIHGIGPRGPPIVLTVSRLFPVVTCPVDASSLSLLLPSKQATTLHPNHLNSMAPLFLSYHHHLHPLSVRLHGSSLSSPII